MTLQILVVVSTVFAAAPEGVDAKGPRIEAVQIKNDSALLRGGASTPGMGEVTLTAQKRAVSATAEYGDLAKMTARFAVGSDLYWLSFDAAGFPPREPHARTLPPPEFGFPVEGGVILDRDVLGATGLGTPISFGSAHASVAAFGWGQIARNRRPLSNRARIQIFAVTSGVDQLVPAGGMLILVDGIPRDREPSGKVAFVVNSVQVLVDGVRVQPEHFDADTSAAPLGVGGSGNAGIEPTNLEMSPLGPLAPAPLSYSSSGGPLPGPFRAPQSRDLVNATTGRADVSPSPPPTEGTIFPTAQTPGAPVPGTPSAPTAGTPSAPQPSSPLFVSSPPVTGPENQAAARTASAFPNGNYPGTAKAVSSRINTSAQATGSNAFAAPGVPLTPTPLNDAPATPLLETPSPLNAQFPATALPATPAPLNSQTPAVSTTSAPAGTSAAAPVAPPAAHGTAMPAHR